MIGNSSAGLREAPYYGIPSINIGSRQNNRTLNGEIINCGYENGEVKGAIKRARKLGKYKPKALFGQGKSNESFHKILTLETFWKTKTQKSFNDL